MTEEVPPSQGTSRLAEVLAWGTLAILFVFSLATLAMPAVRAFYHIDFNYNEGWNVYNTQAAMQHQPLYYPKYDWTTVNYPFLSFYFIGYASHFIGSYLMTGRLISLVALLVSSVLVGLMVKKLTGSWGPAVFAGVFCLGLFCARDPTYIAADDPQMLAHPFFLFGLCLYLGTSPSTRRIAGITSSFILGGNIKQSLVSAPLSVLSDLFATSKSKAVRFMVFGAVLVGLSIAVNMLVGGPYFISHLLTSRGYISEKLRTMSLPFYTPLGLPLVISVIWSIWQLHNRQGRVIAYYFFSSLLIGEAFAGGAGVYYNTFFDNLFAMSIIMGACLDLLWKAPIPHIGKGGEWRFLAPVLLYSSVLFMFGQWGADVPKYLSSLPEKEREFKAQVSFLAAQPGPAICESLIRCYDAGKPYVIDPFNSTRLMRLGKLDSNELVQQIAAKEYGAIQIYTPVTVRSRESFPLEVLNAIDRYYVAVVKDDGCFIYLPRTQPEHASNHP